MEKKFPALKISLLLEAYSHAGTGKFKRVPFSSGKFYLRVDQGRSFEERQAGFCGAFLLDSGLTIIAMARINTFSPDAFVEEISTWEKLWPYRYKQETDNSFFIR